MWGLDALSVFTATAVFGLHVARYLYSEQADKRLQLVSLFIRSCGILGFLMAGSEQGKGILTLLLVLVIADVLLPLAWVTPDVDPHHTRGDDSDDDDEEVLHHPQVFGR